MVCNIYVLEETNISHLNKGLWGKWSNINFTYEIIASKSKEIFASIVSREKEATALAFEKYDIQHYLMHKTPLQQM